MRAWLILAAILLAGCVGGPEKAEYCTHNDTGAKMSFSDAVKIAENSECAEEGRLMDAHFCNEYTGTWWVNIESNSKGCAPACVVNVNTGKAEINWRCTGALP